MTKRVFIIHGWEGYPENGWNPWLKSELEHHDFGVFVPSMPDSSHPKKTAWVEKLAETVKIPDTNCYFVGYSLGAITILRYLETLKLKEKVGGVIMVAGFTDDLNTEDLSSFFTTPINFEKIKTHCDKFIAIHSDNDPWVSLKHADIFKQKLQAEVIIMENMKHFSGDDGITQLPIVLEKLLKFES